MSSSFYRAFEDRHRGSRELILGRLEIYLPFIEKLKELHDPCTALDLGCGRGEWLELLQNNGVEARGVDLDAGMLQACIERDLQVEQRDAIEALKALPDNSLSVVSGFHIVEHIEFSQVQLLVEQALRVLRPGGLIILETPNAENLVVGSHNFYLDPTHIRPVPHILLAFVTELAGFARNKTLRLQEDPQIHHLERPNLLHVLAGVSPDYAVVAQKPSSTEEMSGFDTLFENEYGMSLNHITKHYDQALNTELQGIKHRMEELAQQEETLRTALTQTTGRAEQTAHKNEALTLELHKLELRAVQLETQKEHQRQQMLQSMQRAHQEEMRARQAEAQLHEVSTRAAKFEARYDVSQSNTNSLTKQLEELTSEILSLNRSRQELESQLNISTQQLNSSLESGQEWELKTTELEAELTDITAQYTELQETNAELQQQLNDTNQQLEEVTQQLNSSLENAQEWELQATELEADLTDVTAQYSELQETKAELEQELNNTKQELEEATQQLNITNQQYEETAKKLEETTQQLNESLGNAHNWYLRATELEAEQKVTKAELHDVHQANHHHWTVVQEQNQQIESTSQQLNESLSNAHEWYLRATAAEQRVDDLLRSSSWRITAPLRGLRNLIVWLICLPFRLIKACLRPLLSASIRYAVNRPALRLRWSNRLKAHPRLFAHLKQFAIKRGFVAAPVIIRAPEISTESVVLKVASNTHIEQDNSSGVSQEEKKVGSLSKNLSIGLEGINADKRSPLENESINIWRRK